MYDNTSVPKKKNIKPVAHNMASSYHMTIAHHRVDDIPPHWHSFFEFELVLSGCGELFVNDLSMPLKRGTLYFISTPDIHSAKIEGTCTLLNASFDTSPFVNENIINLLSTSNSFIISLTDKEIKYIQTLHSMLEKEYRSMIPINRMHAVSILETILLFIFEKGKQNHTIIDKSNIMQNAIKYINMHFTENITLQQAASSIYVTSEHFSRKFHSYTGESFSNYILKLRIKYAQTLLATTSLPVSEIATRIGFHSPTYFARIFKKKIGITPSEYRKKNLKSMLKT